MTNENDKQSVVERFNRTSSKWITFFRNLKVLVVAVVAVIALAVGMSSEGGRATIRRLYCQLGGPGVDCEEYSPVADRFDPAMLAAQGAVQADTGIEADYTEFSVHVISENEKKLRWERDGRTRTYLLKNEGGVWVYTLVSADS